MIMPWIISFFIVLSNYKKVNVLFNSEDSSAKNTLMQIIKVCVMATFPVCGFAMLAYHQFQLKTMQRQIKQRHNEQAVRKKENEVANIGNVVAIAGKVTEVVTESSFQPFLQFYVLLTGCNLVKIFGLIFTDPKTVFESDLHVSILFSLINFSWSMTFHHVTKDITVDITANLFQRLVLASSFFMQIGNRLFILCFFGHQ